MYYNYKKRLNLIFNSDKFIKLYNKHIIKIMEYTNNNIINNISKLITTHIRYFKYKSVFIDLFKFKKITNHIDIFSFIQKFEIKITYLIK